MWCTALARKALHDIIRKISPHDHVYNDTDSVKFIGDYDNIFIDYNNKINDDFKLGHYEKDMPYIYEKFKTFGAKKYAFIADGNINITVAGVPKSGAKELKEISNFKLGMSFTKTGKKRKIYNYIDDFYTFKNHTIHLTNNVSLVDVEYKLDITEELEKLVIKLNLKKRGIIQ